MGKKKSCPACGPWWKSVWHFGKTVRHWARRGFRTATNRQYRERREICEACKFYDAKGRRCGECGCWVAIKAALIERPGASDCPKGKWPA